MTFTDCGDPGLEAIKEEINNLFETPETRYESRSIENLSERLDSIIASMSRDRAKNIPTEEANKQLGELQALIETEIDNLEKGKPQEVAQTKWSVEMARIYWLGNKPNTCKNNLDEANLKALNYYGDEKSGYDTDYEPILAAIQNLIKKVQILFPDE